MEYQENMEAPTVSNTATPASDKEDLQARGVRTDRHD